MSVVPGGDVGLETAGWLVAYPTLRYGHNSWHWSAVTSSNSTCATAGACTTLIRLYSAELSALEPEDAERALKSIVQRYIIGVAGAAEWLTAVCPKSQRDYTRHHNMLPGGSKLNARQQSQSS